MASGETAVPSMRAAGLRRSGVHKLSVHRRRCGKGFIYCDEDGKRVRDQALLTRIRTLAIPPAYTDVRIAADPQAHLQAVGRDEAGRLQYRYHADWDLVREGNKVERLAALAGSVGRIRRRVARDIRLPSGSPEKAFAAVIMLIDRTYIRIGCEDYVHSGRSRGAATLLKRNVAVDGENVQLTFRGKGGHRFTCSVRAAALARAVNELVTLPGRRVFQYRDPDGRLCPVTAARVNAYLHDVAGAAVTAKDFRTLAACAEAGRRLAALQPAEKPTSRHRQVTAVIREVSLLLGNTPAVVRKNYVHAQVLEVFEQGKLQGLYTEARSASGRRRSETLIAKLLGARSKPTV